MMPPDHTAEAHAAESGRTEVEHLVQRAIAAQQDERWEDSLSWWREATAAHPDAPALHASELALLQILGRIDEAEVKGRALQARFPGSVDVAAQWLGTAIAREDWVGAQGRLLHVRETFSAHPFVNDDLPRIAAQIRGGVSALSSSELHARCSIAEEEGDTPTVLAAWKLLLDREPDSRTAMLGFGRALRSSRRFERAEEILAVAAGRFDDDLEIAAHYAELPADRGDVAESGARWQTILDRMPDLKDLYGVASSRLAAAGRYAAAELALERALSHEPARVDLHIMRARLAEQQQNWDLAVERWDVAHHLHPEEPNIRNARGDAIWQASAARLERDEALHEQRPIDGTLPDEKELALVFEGLGDHCEFGIVQRRLGAEPIGLFRFAAISSRALTELLNRDLVPLGDPSFIELGLTVHNEYLVRDSRGLYHMHCFVQQGTVDEDRFLRQQVTRLGYLKKKLIEDLETAEKIFVHKSSIARISDEEAIALHDSLLRYGPNSLLVIRCQADDQLAGHVETIRPGLMVGYVNTPYEDHAGDIDEAAWRAMLPKAYFMVRDWRHRLRTGRSAGTAAEAVMTHASDG